MARHWIAQRVLTGEFLHYDLPIQGEPVKELSGTGSLRATIRPDEGYLRGSDGRLLLEPWNTALYVEDDGQIRWGGLIVDMAFDGPDWEIAASGFTAYPFDQPYAANYVGIKVDPADIVRHIWAHLQGYPNGNLGVQVSGSTSYLIGTDSDIRRDAAKVVEEDAKKALDAARKALDDARKANASDSEIAALEAARDDAEADRDKATAERQKLDELVREDGGSYRLNWWDSPDCGNEMQALAREAPFDWVEDHAWNADRTGITHTMRIADAIGARRDNLRFEQGVNVSEVVPYEVDGMDIATEVIGLGAGEGKQALRTVAAVTTTGRLRRARVLEMKDIRDKKRLEAETRYELARSGGAPLASRITVTNHGYARFGAWDVGDVVSLHANVPWIGQTVTWQRIVAWQMVSPSRAVVDLEYTGG